jgi:hypothetical protein
MVAAVSAIRAQRVSRRNRAKAGWVEGRGQHDVSEAIEIEQRGEESERGRATGRCRRLGLGRHHDLGDRTQVDVHGGGGKGQHADRDLECAEPGCLAGESHGCHLVRIARELSPV